MRLNLTYRGHLASCNYDCCYCPFAKTKDDIATRYKDRAAIERFCNWVASREGKDEFELMFTPWGEALVRSWYRHAIVRLSNMPHVHKVVIQTNLSCSTNWMKEVNRNTLTLWTTFHPTEVSVGKFVSKTRELDALNIRYSVGIVGTKENQPIATRLRASLHRDTYLWVNAYKDEANYYCPVDIAFYLHIDPWFNLNLKNYPSKNKLCHASVSAISIDAEGNAAPCHFVKKYLGNIYTQDIGDILRPTFACPNDFCDCYIGYIHLNPLAVEQAFGISKFERIPIKHLVM